MLFKSWCLFPRKRHCFHGATIIPVGSFHAWTKQALAFIFRTSVAPLLYFQSPSPPSAHSAVFLSLQVVMEVNSTTCTWFRTCRLQTTRQWGTSTVKCNECEYACACAEIGGCHVSLMHKKRRPMSVCEISFSHAAAQTLNDGVWSGQILATGSLPMN